jgi:endonuclease/exonuclease/phosphatase (EEP) superfamily protein YafD
VLVVAALLGLAISALDERKLTSLIVAASVMGFGWVAILGPRSGQPAGRPHDPVRVAALALPESGGDPGATLAALVEARADVAILVEPSKKARAILLRTDRFRFTLQSGTFVVVSSVPVRELELPEGLPRSIVVRIQVDRPDGPFILYALRSVDTVLGTTLNDELGMSTLIRSALDERLPVVLAGNLGVSDRSSEYRGLDEVFRDALRSGDAAGGTVGAFPWSLLALRTDYVFTSTSWCAAAGQTFDLPGSDHRGVTSAVGPCPHAISR